MARRRLSALPSGVGGKAPLDHHPHRHVPPRERLPQGPSLWLGRAMSSYTVIGSAKRPRPWPRPPSFTATRRDGSFSPAMYAAMLSKPLRLQRSPIAACIHVVAMPWLRRPWVTHHPASTSNGAIPSIPSPAKCNSATPTKRLFTPSRIAHGPKLCVCHGSPPHGYPVRHPRLNPTRLHAPPRGAPSTGRGSAVLSRARSRQASANRPRRGQ